MMIVMGHTYHNLEQVLAELKNCPDGIFVLATGLKINSRELEVARCMKGSDGKLCFRQERDKV